MNNTKNTREYILAAMRKQGLRKNELADYMDLGPSWVTKLLNGSLKTIKEEHAEKLEKFLSIKLGVAVDVPSPLDELSRLMESNDDLRQIIIHAKALAEDNERGAFTPPYIETKHMRRLGNDIIALCYANEHHAGKVARAVLEMLSNWEPPKRPNLPRKEKDGAY